MPECPQPIEECQSISIDFTCFYEIPSGYPDYTEADLCRLFLRREDTVVFDQEYDDEAEEGITQTKLETSVTTRQAVYSDDGCSECLSTSFTSEEVNINPPASQDYTISINSSSECGGPCTGEIVYTDNLDPENSYTSDEVTCTPFEATLDDSPARTGDEFSSVFIGTDFTQTTTITFSDELTGARAVEILEDLTFPDDANGTGCYSFTTGDQDNEDCPDQITNIRKARVQFKVPTTHLGTYFKEVFDVIEEPEGWDDVTIFRTFYAKDVEREWTGPGTGDQDDPSWLLGAPYDIPAPTTRGVRRIVNRRFWCYPNSPYGFKPQIYGEGAEIVTPP
jgi:hypothetical protein